MRSRSDPTSSGGTRSAADRNDLLYEEKDELFDVGAGRSLDKKMIFLGSYAKTSSEIRYLPADNPTGELKVILPRQAGHEYDVDHYNGLFYITTNKGAKNFRVVTAPIADPSEKNWKPFIDHNPAVKIDGLSFSPITWWCRSAKAGSTYLRVIDMKTRQSHRIATTEADYAHVDRRQSGIQHARPCVTTTSRWSRPSRSTTTT